MTWSQVGCHVVLASASRARGAALDDDPYRRHLVTGRQIASDFRGRRLRGGEAGLWREENDARRRPEAAKIGYAINAAPPIEEAEGKPECR
jgi:hypothetical protein